MTMADFELGNLSEDPERAKCAELLGHIVNLMLTNKAYSRAQLRILHIWVMPPILLHQAKVFFSPEGAPIGYVMWAGLSKHTISRVINDPSFIPHISEWNEGGELWVTDVLIASKNFVRPIQAFLRKLSREYGVIYGIRLRQNGERHVFTKNRVA